MRICIVDAGLGNLRSVQKALERAGGPAAITADPDDLRQADLLVMPGQGGFGDCARALSGELGTMLRERIDAGVPYLGICLGLQVLFESSEEADGARGLGVFRGRVRRFPRGAEAAPGVPLKVPHMGWNRLSAKGAGDLEGALDRRHFYFAHSYFATPEDESLVAARCDHGGPFVAAVAHLRIFACQFHPEKSQDVGITLLREVIGRARGHGWT